MLTIKNNGRSFTLTKEHANTLELKLNKSEYGQEWSHIGDILYKFSIGAIIKVWSVNSMQYDYLYKIFSAIK
tara:strand:+ start:1029 stop:1244 length:216 start_codon:yes stop_codon:yes gene_type:complete